MCKYKIEEDIVIGSITIPYVRSKGVWMLHGGIGETRKRFVIQYAKRLARMVEQPARAGRGV